MSDQRRHPLPRRTDPAAPARNAAIEVGYGEDAVLTIARALFGYRDAKTRVALRFAQSHVTLLGDHALAILEQTLAVGWVVTLARRGGWRQVGDEGRMWHRFSPPGLTYSGFAIDLCRWLAWAPLAEPHDRVLRARPETDGDHLLCYLALDLAAGCGVDRTLARQPALRASPLAWLGFFPVLAGAGDDDNLPSFDSLLAGAGALVIEVLAGELARRWECAERGQTRLPSLDRLVTVGCAKGAVLAASLDAFDAAGRRDLAGFVLDTAAALAAAPPPLAGAAEAGGTVAERARGRAAAVGLVRGLAQVQRWVAEARAIHFFDEGYATAQKLLALWETLGDRNYARLVALADQLESIQGLEAER